MNTKTLDTVSERLFAFLGKENLRYFQLLRSFHGTCSPVLRLNINRKHMPSHPVHFREGMQIRNWMRGEAECDGCNYDDEWITLVEYTIDKYARKPIPTRDTTPS